MHTLSRTDVRRLAVRAQLLDAHRPTGMFEVVRRLALVQNDPTAAVAPSADLVLWSRLGSSYSPGQLRDALDEQTLLELHGFIRPPEDLALYRAEMADWPGRPPLRGWQEDLRDWVAVNNGCRLDILARLRADGPLTARELPDTCVVPWRSSGWTDNRNVTKLIDLLVQRGEVAAAGRRGADRLWDLAERIYPDEVD
ncbi:winged helix-turn-helix domain-containing protein, partial [Micromonospora azadirachtae]